jgi:hypothetical protein
LKQQAQPFVTVPFVMLHRIELAKGVKVSVKGKIDGQDYCHTVTLRADRSGQVAAKVVDPAGDRFDLLFDQRRGTVSLVDALPLPEQWAKVLAKRLASIVVSLLGRCAGVTFNDDGFGDAGDFAIAGA